VFGAASFALRCNGIHLFKGDDMSDTRQFHGPFKEFGLGLSDVLEIEFRRITVKELFCDRYKRRSLLKLSIACLGCPYMTLTTITDPKKELREQATNDLVSVVVSNVSSKEELFGRSLEHH